jgi:predicted dithiol-disulfide oxidoreductase (DUF899 family)
VWGTLGDMVKPDVVASEEWEKQRAELLVAEKEATRALDRVAAARRRLPMVRFSDEYVFTGPDGDTRLSDLFDGRAQLATYQFMNAGPDHLCPGCTAFTDNVPAHGLELLARNGISWATVSDMPYAQIARATADQGWTMPFVSSAGTSFSTDVGAGGGFMLSMFLRDGDDIYRTYGTTQRGVDRLLFSNSIRDLSVFGREEDWEDSPEGWPQHPTYG